MTHYIWPPRRTPKTETELREGTKEREREGDCFPCAPRKKASKIGESLAAFGDGNRQLERPGRAIEENN